MPRDHKVYLQDILVAIGNVAEFVGSMTREQFETDKKTVHAVVRNLEVIGEAVKGLPGEVRAANPEVPWHRIAGLRDILKSIVLSREPRHFRTAAVLIGNSAAQNR
jgi:uncharacterized protein with HEPN domain